MVINYDLVVKNGRIFTSLGLKYLDIFVKDGSVAALGGAHRAEEKIDAKGSIVLPGAIDAHVHFRDPGPTYKEDWESGSISAAAGGITTVIDQPNTDPRTLDLKSFRHKLERASRHSVVDFCINGGPGRIKDLVKQGATAIGEIFAYEHSDEEMQKLLLEVESAQALATIHAEDSQIIRESMEPLLAIGEPEVYSRARPRMAEVRAIEKLLSMTQKVHICHLSTYQGLDLIAEARKAGKSVSCEVSTHHLLFNKKDYREQGTFLKINPPLRDPVDNEALWEGLRNGSIDIVASDHAPHLPEEKKQELWQAPPGVPGVETLLPLLLMAVRSNLLPLERLVDAISARPADIFGLKSKGRISAGKDADLVLVNPRSIVKINADRLHSRAEWTPYQGREAIFPEMTIVRGQIVFDGDLEVHPGFGRFQKAVF